MSRFSNQGKNTLHMSLKRAAEPQSVQQLVNNFEKRLNSVKKELPNISNPSKRATIKKHLKDLNSLQVQIAPLMANAAPDVQDKYERLSGEYDDIKHDTERQIETLDQQAQQQAASHGAPPSGNVLQQSLIDDEAREVEYINRQSADIVEDMKALDEAASMLKEKIDEQHEVVVRVDNTIEDAHEEMVEGNKSLNVAQEHQKASSRCLYTILIIVIIFIVAVGLIVGLTIYFKNKNKKK
ncbi:hypothetical protein TVAG_100030 [Trichomonas vaginalis G3]|uniref:t-SNARE coiled-coil homology domain-containing protein n=1 Tax=Trichomonas vaginalis (strain ATCC PRA-98 / G3) TaxID=412133 RepID=A2EK70_TRIV3|nr:syntaxin-16 family [Trichomonas vaginalis G3]EAY06963.1 hypothetical protein TVAG_100030 [Trichomonas vaginalis G3]KAI5499113.1 syntaxin-16 family [Trichomonas vaginalis G3]|eukprot:XP_001319186.1 hypothetical protein [Trichomonas vaginalis G3]